MTDPNQAGASSASSWRFPRAFWIANSIELFERAAYYGTFITLTLFLTRVVGYRDLHAGTIAGVFAAGIYLLPFFNGALADSLGFRRSLIVAFTLLAIGYGGMGLYPTKGPVLFFMSLLMVGGAFVKPIITGTVAKCSDASNRARAFSLFYMVVNIGAFAGKTVAKPVRVSLGLSHVPLYSAGAAALGLLLVLLFYWPKEQPASERKSQSAREVAGHMLEVLRNRRFLALILITAGFWAIQGQLYASMPKYVLRMVGDGASPEWYANINPAVVVLLVVPITHLVRRLHALTSMGIGLLLIPFSALLMALSGVITGDVDVLGFSLHPVTASMIAGIALQGFAECFLSPRFLEYASKLAPAGKEGVYMGFSHFNTFFAWLFGFILSGFLLERYCPDPQTLSAADQAARLAALAGKGAMPAVYAQAHFIWYVFAAVGFVGFIAMVIFASSESRQRRPAPINPTS